MYSDLLDNNSPVEVCRPRRVAILSLRGIERHVYRAASYELEDVITDELDSAYLLAPGCTPTLRAMLKGAGRLSRRFSIAHKLGRAGAQLSLEEDVDLFFFNPALCHDLVFLNMVKNWRKRSRVAVCWLGEFWRDDVKRFGRRLDVLNEFDHIFCPMYHSTEALRARLSVPVSYLPYSVDAIEFCPWPNPPRRVVDVCSVGAVGASTHTALVDFADEAGAFYHYGTLAGPHLFRAHRSHRHNYAGVLRRSRYFLSYLAQIMNTKSKRGDQEEFGLRYMEGVAAGTVILGDRLGNPGFAENLGWEDAVIAAPFDSADILRVIEALDADPARVERIRRRNVIEALSRHDHLYRWLRVLEIAGLTPGPQLGNRSARLCELATLVGRT